MHAGGHAAAANTLAELQRDMARLGFVVSQIREIEDARQKRLEQRSETRPHAMVPAGLARIVGVGVETAGMLVHEVLSRRKQSVTGPALRQQCGWRRVVPSSRAGVQRCASRVVGDADEHVSEMVPGVEPASIGVGKRINFAANGTCSRADIVWKA